MLDQMGKERLSLEMTLDQEGAHCGSESVGRENGICKGPEVRCARNIQRS